MEQTEKPVHTRKACPHCQSLDIKKHKESNRETSNGKNRKTYTVSRNYMCVKCKKTFLTPSTIEITLKKPIAPPYLIKSIAKRHEKKNNKGEMIV